MVWLGAAAIYALIFGLSLALEYFIAGIDERVYLRFDAPHLLLLGIVTDVLLPTYCYRRNDSHSLSGLVAHGTAAD